MADSSPEELPNEQPIWIFYKDRLDWKDVQPVVQEDGPSPIVSIAYSEKFRDVYDYFRAIIKSNEKSDRALQLTKDALELNPANYTVWQYRRELLKHLGKDLQEELWYMKGVIEDNPKNYQVWHHRRVIVEWLGDPSSELSLTRAILTQDAKNYHAWQHRQWVLKTFNLLGDELLFVDWLLSEDLRNNSAWNQRYFVISHSTGFTPEVVQRELNFTMDKIRVVANNESPWNYLRGILKHESGGLDQGSRVRQFCEELYLGGSRCPFLLGFLVDMCEMDLEHGDGDKVATLARAQQLCEDLAMKYDTIRQEFWQFVARGLTHGHDCTFNLERDGCKKGLFAGGF